MAPSKKAYVAVAEEEHELTLKAQQHRSIHDKSIFASRHGHWKPFSLRPTGLLLFTATLLCILAALVAIWSYARGHHGLDLVTTNHYTWTYGPTAIFILVISYWRLVDYHFKALVPWAELANGPASADRSILLDYVSPFLVTTLVLATKRGHLAVCMSITGFLLLKVITIASTGLFFPAIITVGPFEQQMLQTSQFDLLTNFSEYSDPGASPFYEAYAVMQLGLPLPNGLTTELLYETYKPTTDKTNANATYSVAGRAFAPRVRCEAVNVKPLIDWDSFGSTVMQFEELQVQNTSRWTCPQRTGSGSELNLQVTDVASRLAPARQLLTSFGPLDCRRVDQKDDSGTAPYLVALSDVRYNQTFNVSTVDIAVGDMIEPVAWEFAIPKITSMLCTIDYNIVDVNILYNMSLVGNPAQRVDVLEPSNPPKLANLPNTYLSRKLGYAAPTSLSGARDMFGLFTQFEDVEEPPHTVLTMIADRVNSNFKYLLDHPESFKDTTEYVMNNMILQIAKEAIIIHDTNSTFKPQQAPSQEYHSEEKLVVQNAPFLVNVVGMSLLVLITIGVFIVHPKSFMSTNPEALAIKVDILKNSNKLSKTLEHLANLSEKSANSTLRQSVYQNDIANSSIISYSSPNDPVHEEATQHHAVGPDSAYAPLTLSKICIALTLLSAPAAIGALEILQHLSDSDFPGIATIQTANSFVISIYSRFLPALVALLISTMFNCLDFNTAMLAPYNHLATGSGSYEDFNTPILAHIAPVAIVTAFRRRYWAACLTGLGALVGSVLTIVISGLYTVEYMPSASNMSISQGDSWNMSYIQGFQTDNAATAVSSLIESANLSYPQFTYDQLAFPTLNTIAGASGNVAVIVPALRAELVCKELPWETSNASIVWKYYKSSGFSAITFNVTAPLPETCHYGSCFGNESTIRATLSDTATKGSTNTSYYAQAIDLHTGPYHASDEDCYIDFTDSGIVTPNQPTNQPGCPSILLVYGYFDGNDHSKSTWTSMLCEQRVQQVNTSLVMSLPEKNILLDPPPTPDESTAKYLDSGDNGEKAFGWWLSSNMEYSHILFNKSAIDPILSEGETSVSNNAHDFSNFFRGAFFGKTPLQLETLQKNDTETKALIFDHVHMFYKRYMAQYLSSNLRVHTTTEPQKRDDNIISSSTTNGLFTPTAGVPRLVQHRTPKIVLQAMLAFMLVCAVLALWLGKYHNLVLWNPCTIAGVMVLFAGSKMCEVEHAINTSTILAPKQTARMDGRDVSHNTTYEMTNFSKLRLSNHDKSGRISMTPGEKAELLQGPVVSASGRDWKNGDAAFRLGWWVNGDFMGA
ncbi:hypothetical protein H2198_002822 [Neophaeococcomyces mojaviensis]|uniref:Uncharacterized protein n=1 Tax=Neophaeococcomyces mojaviensis TaxID=3383035 RepID=A0ACC3AD48_9EURO|nr:hypothetical protein H2198_002822 [Knufia sp. JES_112]